MDLSGRLSAAGFMESVQVSVVDGLLKRCCLDNNTWHAANQRTENWRKVAAVPYLHRMAICRKSEMCVNAPSVDLLDRTAFLYG